VTLRSITHVALRIRFSLPDAERLFVQLFGLLVALREAEREGWWTLPGVF